VQKGCRVQYKSRNFLQFFDVRGPFRAKWLRSAAVNRNFSSGFDVQGPFRAKGLRSAAVNRNFSSVFDVRGPFRAKGCVSRHSGSTAPGLKRELERRAREDLQI